MAASATVFRSAPDAAVTTAATAPSTKGASTMVTSARGWSSRTVRAVRTAALDYKVNERSHQGSRQGPCSSTAPRISPEQSSPCRHTTGGPTDHRAVAKSRPTVVCCSQTARTGTGQTGQVLERPAQQGCLKTKQKSAWATTTEFRVGERRRPAGPSQSCQLVVDLDVECGDEYLEVSSQVDQQGLHLGSEARRASEPFF